MNRQQLIDNINKKSSFLCVGLDTDPARIPHHLRSSEDPIFEFNRQIIDATADLCVAYKINTAFYEAQGAAGWKSLKNTCNYITDEHFKIADAKRGDIGNTSNFYAKAFFETLDFDAITLTPYMGEDSVRPFLKYQDKWIILLALTSNSSSKDFQQLELAQGNILYEEVIKKSRHWASQDQIMYVVGATQSKKIAEIRQLIPEYFLLIPGVGAQGGDLAEVTKNGITKDCGLLVNISRGIIYASEGEDFAEAARNAASQYKNKMKLLS